MTRKYASRTQEHLAARKPRHSHLVRDRAASPLPADGRARFNRRLCQASQRHTADIKRVQGRGWARTQAFIGLQPVQDRGWALTNALIGLQPDIKTWAGPVTPVQDWNWARTDAFRGLLLRIGHK